MSEGMMQPTLQAVECSQCKTLHRANSSGYILIVGEVLDPGKSQRGGPSKLVLGDKERNIPLVVCKREECICKALGQEHLV